MNRKDLIRRISALMQKIDSTSLSRACGNYYWLQKADNGCQVLSFVGTDGYAVQNIEDLPTSVIQKIFDDLAVDFEL